MIDVDAPCDEVVARIRARLQGELSLLSELLVPVSKVGAGPPDFVGRVVGRSFRLRTTWRPSFAIGHDSLLEVIGLVEPTGTGSRIRALIRPRRLMYLGLAPLAGSLVIAVWRREWPVEFAVLAAVMCLWGLSVVRRDIHRAAVGLSELVGP